MTATDAELWAVVTGPADYAHKVSLKQLEVRDDITWTWLSASDYRPGENMRLGSDDVQLLNTTSRWASQFTVKDWRVSTTLLMEPNAMLLALPVQQVATTQTP